MDDAALRLDFPGAGTYERFLYVLRTVIGPGIGNQSLIDLCSHIGAMSRRLEFKEKVFVDVGDHSAHFEGLNFVRADVVNDNHDVFNRVYDVATCLDGIEHVQKPDGVALLHRMESLAKKRILFTPLDPWMIDASSTDPEAHKCVWTPDELPGWAHVVFRGWHPSLGIGAFFFWQCDDLQNDFARVRQEFHKCAP